MAAYDALGPAFPNRQGSMEDLVAAEERERERERERATAAATHPFADVKTTYATGEGLRIESQADAQPAWPPVPRDRHVSTPSQYLALALPVARKRVLDTACAEEFVALTSPYDMLETICDTPGSAERMRAWMVATDACLGPKASGQIFLHLAAGLADAAADQASTAVLARFDEIYRAAVNATD